jgi:hypothetical protein
VQRAMSFVAVQALFIASLLPSASGCAGSGASSVFDPEDAAPVYDPPPFWSGGSPVLVAKGQEALSLALDSSNVYWQNPGGSVFACPLSGCPDSKSTLLSSLVGPASGTLQTLAASDGVALFLTDSGVTISSFAGADPSHSPTTYRTTGGTGFLSLVTDATHAYFVDEGSAEAGYAPEIDTCALGAHCSSPERLYEGPRSSSLSAVFVAGSDVYFVSVGTTSSIRAVPIHGGSVRTVCSSTLLFQTHALAVAAGNVYFTTGAEPASIYRCAASGGGDASVYLQDLQPYALASDGANLYWTNYVSGPGSVVTCALGATCGSPFTVASNQDHPFAIAANAKSVYWSTASKVYRADR